MTASVPWNLPEMSGSGGERYKLRKQRRNAGRGPVLQSAAMADVSDAALVACIANEGRDRADAEAVLCRRFAPRVRLYGLKHLRNEDLARELVQRVLLEMLTAARQGRIRDPLRLDRYVLGISRNLARRLRESAHRDVLPEPIADFEERWLDVPALLRCVLALEPRARDVVHMSFFDECSTHETAERLGTSAGNVRVIRHRAILSLRQCLDHPRPESRHDR